MASSRSGQWFPPEWPERIRAFVRGELVPVAPRRAATVLLLRDGAEGAGGADGPGGAGGVGGRGGARGGPEVYLLRRRASMAFAAGAYAYPGGSVDPRDEAPVAWAGPSRAVWARRLGVPEAVAQSVVCAAVRETFEEAGVLLAGPSGTEVVADATGPEWEADRSALVAREQSFAQFLARRALVLRSDLLGGWARWITPEFEDRRYDTWFFVAELPAGQRGRNASTEADRAAWTTPAAALARYERGELLMMPPTTATLRELASHATAADALAAAAAAADRELRPVLARVRREDGQVVVDWPGYAEFEKRVPWEPAAGTDPAT